MAAAKCLRAVKCCPRLGWARASGCSLRRVWCIEADAPADLSAARGGAAPDRSHRADGDRDPGHHRLRLTIAKGTLPLAIVGPVGYGLCSAVLGAPARAAQAGAPLIFGLLLDRMGLGALAISAGLSLAALLALLMLNAHPAPVPAAAE